MMCSAIRVRLVVGSLRRDGGRPRAFLDLVSRGVGAWYEVNWGAVFEGSGVSV